MAAAIRMGRRLFAAMGRSYGGHHSLGPIPQAPRT